MITYRWIKNIKEFEKISQAWDELLFKSREKNPFLLSDFILTWWKYYHVGLRLRILSIYENKNLIGGIPLYLGHATLRKGFVRTLSYIGDGTANYTEPLFPSHKLFLPILKIALLEHKDWDMLQLMNVRTHCSIRPTLNKIQLSPLLIKEIYDHDNWAIDLTTEKENYTHTLPKKLRRDLKSRRRRLIKQCGEIILQPIYGQKTIQHYFNLYVNFSHSAYADRHRKSTFQNQQYMSFFRDFLVLMDQKDLLDAHVLFSGEHAVAISFAYRFGKGFNWVLTGYNTTFKKFRPGYLLIEEIIHEMNRRGETYYNWYGHKAYYKQQWCNRTEPLYRIKIFRDNLYCRFHHRAEEFIRTSPKIKRIVKIVDDRI